MTVLHNEIFVALSQLIQSTIEDIYEGEKLELKEIYLSLVEPPKPDMGHFAFPCFPLAKKLRAAPPAIATKICESFPEHQMIESAVATGPYVNFKLKPRYLGEHLISAIIKGEFFEKKLSDRQDRTMIEYSQPNTHKILHVGHMRNLCLGNAVVRLCRYAGEDVIAVTYPGDVGTHVAKCLWYLEYHNKEAVPESAKGDWLGKIYTLANEKLENEKGTDKEEENRRQLTDILKQIHDERGEFYDLWRETRKWSIDLMEEAYAWADVSFDRWFWESEMDAKSLAYAHELHEKGLLIKDQGAIGMNLNDDDLGFCMLVKSDGTGLYATKDIELAKVKFEEFGVDRNIYIVDFRQAHHFKQVFKVLEKIGFEKAKDCFHLQYAMVELPDGGMSSRKGNIVPLTTLIEQMEDKIKKDYLNKYLSDTEQTWSEDEVEKTATAIANGAIKFGMIRIDNNRKIVFDMDEWLKLDGETGPYLQYVYARICSLGDKLGFNSDTNNVSWEALKEDAEKNLMIKLSLFNNIVMQSVDQLKPIHLCSYLYDLGKLFNVFYNQCPIGKAETEELKRARLSLAYASGQVIKTGLEVLGINAPKRM